MPLQTSGTATGWTEIDRFDGGVGWIAYPGETLQRASHALATDDGVWVIDPVDVPDLDDLLAEFGDLRGVVLLLNRHKRDCAAVARRHDVSVRVPSFMKGVAGELDAPVELIRHDLGDTGYAVHEAIDNPFWKEAVMYSEDREVLVVPEAVGTTEYFRTGDERLGVHPMLRLRPPTKLGRFDPERILVGHGPGVHEDATAALEESLSGARSRTPSLYLENLKMLLPG